MDKVKGGWLDFDKAVATPDMMAKVGQIGKILGSKRPYAQRQDRHRDL